jgi:hypothetical protein
MVALRARRLVCSAIAVINFTTSPIRCAARDSVAMRSSASLACTTAASAIRLEPWTWRPISSTDAESSSVAVATDCILEEACSETLATWLDKACVVSAVRVGVVAAVSSYAAEAETVDTIEPTALSK